MEGIKIDDSLVYTIDGDLINCGATALDGVSIGTVISIPFTGIVLTPTYDSLLKENAELKALVAKYKEMIDG